MKMRLHAGLSGCMSVPLAKRLLVNFIVITGLMLTASRTPAQTGVLAGLDAYVTNTLAQWGVPGMSIGIVANNQIQHLQGYGFCATGRNEAVDSDTIFRIGSLSKSFTATVLGMLSLTGHLNLDNLAVTYLPNLTCNPAELTQQLTIHDLLTMQSGIGPLSETLLCLTDMSRTEVLERLRYVPPDSAARRGAYAYRNVNYLLAGQMVTAIACRSWEDFVRQQLFQPLGMTRTSPTIHDASNAFDNLATAHVMNSNGIPTAISVSISENGAPAGAIISSARDMLQWVKLNLGQGVCDGARVVEASVIKTTHMPAILAASSNVYYGMGWICERRNKIA